VRVEILVLESAGSITHVSREFVKYHVNLSQHGAHHLLTFRYLLPVFRSTKIDVVV